MNPLRDGLTQTPAGRPREVASERPVDVVVLGGGPAGTATAIALASFGWRVTILERSHYESARIGETLPPEIKRPLIALGLWEAFLADNPVESPGIASAWGRAELYDQDFIVNPDGPGWHVDRRRFDTMLAHAAQESGVDVLCGARGISLTHFARSWEWDDENSVLKPDHCPVLRDEFCCAQMAAKTAGMHNSDLLPPCGGGDFLWDGSGICTATPSHDELLTRNKIEGTSSPVQDRRFISRPREDHSIRSSSTAWHVGAVVDGQRLERRAAVLVDATGRSASPGRRLAGHRIVYDRLVGLVGFTSAVENAGDRRTLIEAVASGWWYSAPLPDGRQVAAFMTDADLVPAGPAACARFWRDRLRRSTHTRARIDGGALAAGPRIVAACSSRPPFAAGEDWVAVGDAAAAFDPLSSQGVAWALESGLMAAQAIDAHLRGTRQALPEYAREVKSEFVRYLAMRADYYGRERRWPGSPFWRRRHAAAIRAGARGRLPPLKIFGKKSENSGNGIRSQTYLII